MWTLKFPLAMPPSAARGVLLTMLLTLGWAAQANALSCAVETGAVNFGVYNPRAPAATTSNSGYVDMRCTCSALIDCIAFGYTVEITGPTARQMKRSPGGDILTYGLFKDPLAATVFGSGANGQGMLYLLGLFGSAQRIPIYGAAAAGQVVRPGSYADTLSVVVTY